MDDRSGAEGRNLLFVTFDQLRADVLDGRLSGLVPLPAFDRLRREGVLFSNAFAATVPCGPARASLLTGLYAFNHRSIRNGTPLARHHDTLAAALARAGREPLLFGYCDVTPDPTGRSLAEPAFRSYEQPADGFREILALRAGAPFEWIALLERRGYRVPRPQPERVSELYRPSGDAPRIGDPAFYAAGDSDTAFLADAALSALDARRDQPFLAHVTFIRPHPPLVAPAPYNRAVAPEKVPPPAAPGFRHPFRDAWFGGPSQQDLFHGFRGDVAGLSAADVAALRGVYLGLVQEADHHLGRLLDWLDRRGLSDRTLVVATADHGDMLGDQGFFGKDNVLAAAHRVPLLVRGPGVTGGRTVEAMVSSVDLAPTILAFFGLDPPAAMDGISLLPALAGGAGPDRPVALTEVDLAQPEPVGPTRFQRHLGLHEHRANAAVVRDRRHTLVHFNGGLAPLLFDRAADPDETRDLAREPSAAHTIARLRAALLDLFMERADRRLTGHALGLDP